MIQINITHELDQLKKKLNNIERQQIPFATKNALNDTANELKAAEVKQLDKDIDRPTPFTKRAFFIKGATKKRLVAVLGIKDIQAKYLGIQIKGGTQTPANKAILTPANIKLNKYGNLTKGRIKKLLDKPNTFSGKVGGVAGIWERNKKGGLKLLVRYKDKQDHKPRFKFYDTAEEEVKSIFPVHLKRNIALALKTAR